MKRAPSKVDSISHSSTFDMRFAFRLLKELVINTSVKIKW